MKEIVYLVGPPCTGKSTILKEWQNKGGIAVPEFLEPVPDFVVNAWNQDREVQLAGQQWIMGQHIRKDIFIKNLDVDGVIAVERSPLDALVYSRVFGGEINSWTEIEVAQRNWQPGLMVLLTVGPEIIKDRWVNTRNLPLETWENQWAPFTHELQRQYKHFSDSFGFPNIQTGNTLEDTMNQLYAIVNGNKAFYCVENLINSWL